MDPRQEQAFAAPNGGREEGREGKGGKPYQISRRGIGVRTTLLLASIHFRPVATSFPSTEMR